MRIVPNTTLRIRGVVVVLSVLLSTTGAFSAFRTTTTAVSTTKETKWDVYARKRLYAIPPELMTDMYQHSLSSASTFLSDVATAAADAVVTVEDGGWWDDYLNIFKASLIFVHSKIDQPLRSVGWDQTWGVSIALFTACVRTALVPLSVQQSKSSEYVKALKPYQDQIKARFKGRKEIMNRAIAKLYEDANANPFAGCLFSLVQLPVFLGLYRSVTLLAQEGQLQEPFLWIPSLEGPVSAPTYRGLDWLLQGWTFNGFPEPSLGWSTTLAFLVMPVVLVLGQSLTMQVLQPPMDESMGEEERQQMEKTQVILKFLPLLIGYFSLQVPAGLTIYWLTSNIYTLLQSLAVRSYYTANPPKVELPEYWDALDSAKSQDEITPEERRKAAEAGLATGPSYEDLLDEARFHYVVDRSPLRQESDAWKRTHASFAAANGDSNTVPTEMSAWVEMPTKTEAKEESTANM